MSDGLFILAATVFLSLGYIYMTPVPDSACRGEQLEDGIRFNMPDDFLKPDCYVDLIVEGKKAAVYKGGKPPNSVLPPVMVATKNFFVLDNYPKSGLMLDRECENGDDRTVYCSCSAAHSNTSTSFLTELHNPEDNSTANSPGYRHHQVLEVVIPVGLGLGLLVLATVFYNFARVKYKMWRVNNHNQDEDPPAKTPLPTSYI